MTSAAALPGVRSSVRKLSGRPKGLPGASSRLEGQFHEHPRAQAEPLPCISARIWSVPLSPPVRLPPTMEMMLRSALGAGLGRRHERGQLRRLGGAGDVPRHRRAQRRDADVGRVVQGGAGARPGVGDVDQAPAHDAPRRDQGESDLMLDTHAVARSLTAADFTPAQADALTDALRFGR